MSRRASTNDADNEILANVKPDHKPYYRHVIDLRRALVGAPML
jgi:hypothetical protein